MIKTIRKYHKWLMAFVGLQFLIWSVTGLYMVSLNIHFIHGENLAQHQQQKLNLAEVHYSINALLADFPGATGIKLTSLMGQPVYRFNLAGQGKQLIDASTGKPLGKVDQNQAKQIAQYYYTGNQEIQSIKLMTKMQDMPAELSPRHLPFWQVTFADFANPTFYIQQDSGAIVTKRHDYWRAFDWMWRFHIMDYDDGENVANWFLLVIACLALLAALAGVILTYFRVVKAEQQEQQHASV
ncbi:PepSY domain-containing protein [Paraglaciecola aestuariivivens]